MTEQTKTDIDFAVDLNRETAMRIGKVWRESALFASLREPGSAGACASCGSYDACRGGCMAAKFFTGLELTDPDPECVHGHGETARASRAVTIRPRSSSNHSALARS